MSHTHTTFANTCALTPKPPRDRLCLYLVHARARSVNSNTHRSGPRWWTPTRTSYPLSAPRCSSSAALTKSPPTPFESSSHSTTTTSPTSRSYAAINQSINQIETELELELELKLELETETTARASRAEPSRVVARRCARVCVSVCVCVREHPLVRENVVTLSSSSSRCVGVRSRGACTSDANDARGSKTAPRVRSQRRAHRFMHSSGGVLGDHITTHVIAMIPSCHTHTHTHHPGVMCAVNDHRPITPHTPRTARVIHKTTDRPTDRPTGRSHRAISSPLVIHTR